MLHKYGILIPRRIFVSWRPYNHLTFKWSKSSQYRSELNWPELSTSRKYLSLLTVHDILHKRIALRFSDYFTFSSLCTQSHSLSLYCRSSTIKVTGNALNIEYYFWWCDYCFGLLIHHNAPFHFMVSISDEYKYKR